MYSTLERDWILVKEMSGVNNLRGMRVEMFPQEVIDLNEEVAKHPPLMDRLNNQENKDFYVLLAEVAAHCGIIMNDTYTPEMINKLCVMLKEELYKRRTGLVIIH